MVTNDVGIISLENSLRSVFLRMGGGGGLRSREGSQKIYHGNEDAIFQ